MKSQILAILPSKALLPDSRYKMKLGRLPIKRSRHLGTLCVSFCLMTVLSPLPVRAIEVSDQGTWKTTLQARDLDGNTSTTEAYYDTDLNITWLADANYAQTLGDADGLVSWIGAIYEAPNLNINNITGWRLPTAGGTPQIGCVDFGYTGTACGYNVDTSTSEMAHMFYITLGNKAYYDTSGVWPQEGWGLTNTGPFTNLQSNLYWSGDGESFGCGIFSFCGAAWGFSFYGGRQDYYDVNEQFYVWYVHSGDVGAAVVSLPTAVWLFGSGLLGLVGIARNQRKIEATKNGDLLSQSASQNYVL